MLGRFFKRKAAPKRDRIEELANKLGAAGKLDRLEGELERRGVRGLTAQEVETWHHQYGACAFRRGEHELAMERFKHGLETCPDSQLIRFSLAQEHIYLGGPAEAFEQFDDCAASALPSQYVMAMSRYAYLFSDYGRGINYIQRFFDAYLELKILDDHFLFMRALPFFHETWSYLAVHCKLGGQTDLLVQITAEARRTCSDYDFETLDVELEAVLTDSYARLRRLTEDQLFRARREGWPADYLEATVAAWRAQSAESYQRAVSGLDAWQLSREAWPWLEDVRLLAKAQAAQRFCQPEEAALVEEFLSRQPLLFEPDHALSFRFVDYQELLKPRLPLVTAA